MNLAALVLAVPSWLPDDLSDFGRAGTQLYSVVLLATVPLLLVAVASTVLRRASAGTRTLIWRGGAVALLLVYIGQLLPLTWMTSAVPAGFATPLVTLGRMQLAAAGPVAASGSTAAAAQADGAGVVLTLLFVYWLGVAAVLYVLVRAARSVRATTRQAIPSADRAHIALLGEALASLGIRRRVQLRTGDVPVPVTSGVFRPVIVLPDDTAGWSRTKLRAVLLHELAHVRAADVLFAILARVMCALFWFHPAAWWIARRLRLECEIASDDCVLTSGVRPSEYAEMLLSASDTAVRRRELGAALGLTSRGTIYRRIEVLSDAGRDLRTPRRARYLLAAALTIAVAGPVSGARLAPSRDFLTSLMRDERWETRAYAVMGLAQRPDSIEVARAASELDPDPNVRVLARVALDHSAGSQQLDALLRALPALLHDRH